METVLQSSCYVLIKATPLAPDTLLGLVRHLSLTEGEKNHFFKRKANTDLLIHYLHGVLPKLQESKQDAGGWGVVGTRFTLWSMRADTFG